MQYGENLGTRPLGQHVRECGEQLIRGRVYCQVIASYDAYRTQEPNNI